MMMFFLVVLLVLLVVLSAASISFPVQPPTFDASEYTTWGDASVLGSRRSDINIPFKGSDGDDDNIHMIRLDLIGSSYNRGYAHGALLTKEIVEFMGPKLDKFFMDQIANLDVSNYPKAIQDILKLTELAAPLIFKKAMSYVWEKEKDYVPQHIHDEINGMANGVCSNLGPSCSVDEWNEKIQQLNMLPELIRMACTAYGAYGKASQSGGLIQLRALDFGTGPFANYTIVSVSRGATENENQGFVSISFPGFVGAITGISQSGIGISEKVWMVYKKHGSLLPGSYNGLADVLVLREILEFSKTREEAEAYLASVKRTWAIWVGIGDYASQKFDLVGYKEDSATPYTDATMPQMTGQPYLEDICYVDKHPQPSGDGPTGTLPTALQAFYGNITLDTTKVVTQYHQTGDLHTAIYDYKSKQMYLSIGRINHDGKYCPDSDCSDPDKWMAYNRPSVKFNLEDLWAGY